MSFSDPVNLNSYAPVYGPEDTHHSLAEAVKAIKIERRHDELAVVIFGQDDQVQREIAISKDCVTISGRVTSGSPVTAPLALARAALATPGKNITFMFADGTKMTLAGDADPNDGESLDSLTVTNGNLGTVVHNLNAKSPQDTTVQEGDGRALDAAVDDGVVYIERADGTGFDKQTSTPASGQQQALPAPQQPKITQPQQPKVRFVDSSGSPSTAFMTLYFQAQTAINEAYAKSAREQRKEEIKHSHLVNIQRHNAEVRESYLKAAFEKSAEHQISMTV